MNQLGHFQLAECEPVFLEGPPEIRLLAPGRGPTGTLFTLVGRNFSPVPSDNFVMFARPGEAFSGAVATSTRNSIVGFVPEGLDFDLYRVSVGIRGLESNGVGFQVSSTTPRLELVPFSATLLLPPGSGKETLVVAGGTPPYKLKPLSETDQAFAQVSLNWSVIDVIRSAPGFFTVEVEDSAATPVTVRSNVRLQTLRFEPFFQIVPHTLLAGATPGYTILLSHNGGQMRLDRTEFRFDKVQADFASLKEGSLLALGKQLVLQRPQGFQILAVSEVVSASELSFEANGVDDGVVELQGLGTLEGGSAVLSLSPVPGPPPESVVGISFQEQILLNGGILRLPESPGESFDVTGTFTSATVKDGEDLPLTKVLKRTFTTVTPPSGGPRIESAIPVLGPVGQLVTLTGTGFAATPEGNQVTFPDAENGRLEAVVESASSTQIKVRVPQGAVTGPFRVSVNELSSNDYQFLVLFRPDAAILFPEFTAGQAVAPVIVLGQEDRFRTAVTDRDIQMASLKVTLDDGNIQTATLQPQQAAGTAERSFRAGGSATEYLLVYGGQEPDGEQRHFFDFKQTLEGNSQGSLFFSDNPAGSGVIFDVIPGFSMLGRNLEIRFDEAVYLPPAVSGTIVNTRSEVRSGPWSALSGTEMVVVFPGQVETQ